ncbi:YhdH/YhfP family quinone oxidoreductase [Enterococcus avium]|uniref:YhdH/YhfP family quinone oxidoreductase n=1 Tax=Enterococcus avium TaxID=33945 RepID=UPI00232B1762|nr:YhdH/YhfP family quinone oxidoreductase [Enterococcus avium]MDB1750523.1 YhdH/YhfP family quinone oxidoreductase [Enterococcus avium]MDB1754166.1 YhdH/YhfP family quinone oxidoreductase [Enterococcus avium]MDB1761295.1 YhdH/YhfP family quinone oxidoreductase [Enterococcus avium]
MTYRRLRVINDETLHTEIESFTKPEIKENEVLVKVNYSGINYKDALASRPNTGVLREYPMTPGIDLAGTIIESKDKKFQSGDEVLVTGFGIGVKHDGGLSDVQVVPAAWVVHLPEGLSAKQAMIFGTAGFTAALAVDALQTHGLNAESRVLVTGATGGVGGFALHFLKQIGCKEITALSRKEDQKDYLQQLGATAVLSPAELFPEKARPLNKQLFDFVIDTVGGDTLAQVLPFINYGGSAALCGNAGGIKLSTTVLPFILRGVNLLGIDSVEASMEQRQKLWKKMANEWALSDHFQVQQIELEQVLETANALLEGKHVGRTIVALGGTNQ